MKSIFKNKKFYKLLLCFIVILILWNIYVLITSGSFIAFLPIVIECALLILILTHDRYAKTGILAWTIIFIVVAPALSVLGTIMGTVDNGFKEITTYKFAFDLLSMIIGILIVDYTRRTVTVERSSEITVDN